MPSVHAVLERLEAALPDVPRALLLAEVRAVLAEIRLAPADIPDAAALAGQVAGRIAALRSPSLVPVINATGVVLHTNLGRAPLGDWTPISGYSNLEYDLDAGRRGRRDQHMRPLLDRLFGASAMVVNNGAAALFLALHELARGGEVIVSRGELIEIGDGFRVPDVLARSGARL
ncbi:MAG TPA: L-seryl-tRNA(Sec) selenium transferase, partial [Solibacterales bacterium]|nr:L-seryl-tRNA(Sec) selenium transferase [Bryobacterales bacterium]